MRFVDLKRAIGLAFIACFILGARRVDAQSLQDQLVAEGAEALAKAARETGDAQRGAIIFHQAHLACAKCHALGEGAESLGPNLATPEKKPAAEHLVESILEPSKVVRPEHQTVTVELANGNVFTGIIAEDGPRAIVLKGAAADGKPMRIPKTQIERQKPSPVSLMPAGQANQLGGRQPFLDLVRYLIEIAEGGPERAKQLHPPAALLALQIPDYERQIDHVGMISSLDGLAFKRGEAIYNRLCVNCHGTRAAAGSLPTSLRFAEGKFKSGSDPYRMYQTLTYGYGLMTPQTWMVPQQKYDVVHYIREAYLKQPNPTQYFQVNKEYLAGLPQGTSRGPAPSNIEPWSAMNYGPYLTATYEVGADGSNFAHKGIAVRLDGGAGGVSRGRHWLVFEHDTLRTAAAWSSPPAAGKEAPNFIDWAGINFNGQHQVHPHVVGQVQFANPTGPGWANPETGSFDDPRVVGRDGKHYGPLPRAWGKYRGLYQYGDQVILSFTVGETPILEMPGVVEIRADGEQQSKEKSRAPIVTRMFHIGPRPRDLQLQVASVPDSKMVLSDVQAERDGKPPFPIAVLAGPEAKEGELRAGLSAAPAGAAWKSGKSGELLLNIPAGQEPLKFVLSLRNQGDGAADLEPLVSQPVIDLTTLTRGGPRRWPEVLSAEVAVGASDGPFAVDTFSLPANNPWFCQLRLTGFDFFPAGDRMTVCSWDGDVWLVSGLAGLPSKPLAAAAPRPKLTWQRIASGLFQPLGLKIVGDAIHVACRDQIVVLRDANGDGETDFYECLNSDHQVTEHFHEFAMGLQTDAAGNFYYAKSARHALPAVVPHHGTLLKVSADGARTEILANGFRAANGVCLNADGSFVVTDQEGHWNPKNRINWVKPGGFYGNMFGYHDVTDAADSAMQQPLCWITNTFDRSPAELLWVPQGCWGPLSGSLLNLSYGYGKVFVVPHEELAGQMQGGMCELPLPLFPTGIMRGRFHPVDDQLYACGMFAWAGNATAAGGLYRIRYTDQPVYLPAKLRAKRGGLEIEFTGPLAEAAAKDTGRYEVKTWSLRRTSDYGSKHFDERKLTLSGVRLSADRRTVLLELPDIQPTWCMSVEYKLQGENGKPVVGLIHNTIHNLGE